MSPRAFAPITTRRRAAATCRRSRRRAVGPRRRVAGALLCVMAAPFDGERALEIEDLYLLDRFVAADELVAAQNRVEDPEVGATREIARAGDLGAGEHCVAGK